MSSAAFEVPRRNLSGRRPETAARLLDAAVSVIAETGYDGLTLGIVAKAAGVSKASAYVYFSSKQHLLAEVFWRRVQALPDLRPTDGASPADRVREAVAGIALLVADEPELAAGVTTALLAHDPDVKALQAEIGNAMAARLSTALGDAVPESARLPFALMLMGALLTSGMGLTDYRALPDLLAGFTELLTKEP